MTRARSDCAGDPHRATTPTHTGRHLARARRPGRVLCVTVTLVLMAGCGGRDRPSDDAWRESWERRRDLIPDGEAIVDGGAELCGELVGELRVELSELRPTPTEALDGPVDAWIAHAESIAFDCPRDPDDLANRLRTLDLLATEIEAGLAADAG